MLLVTQVMATVFLSILFLTSQCEVHCQLNQKKMCLPVLLTGKITKINNFKNLIESFQCMQLEQDKNNSKG